MSEVQNQIPAVPSDVPSSVPTDVPSSVPSSVPNRWTTKKGTIGKNEAKVDFTYRCRQWENDDVVVTPDGLLLKSDVAHGLTPEAMLRRLNYAEVLYARSERVRLFATPLKALLFMVEKLMSAITARVLDGVEVPEFDKSLAKDYNQILRKGRSAAEDWMKELARTEEFEELCLVYSITVE